MPTLALPATFGIWGRVHDLSGPGSLPVTWAADPPNPQAFRLYTSYGGKNAHVSEDADDLPFLNKVINHHISFFVLAARRLRTTTVLNPNISVRPEP